MLKRRQKRIDAAAGQSGVSALGTLTSAGDISAAGDLTGAGTLSGAAGLTRAGELAGPDPGRAQRHRRDHAPSCPEAEDSRRPADSAPPAPPRRATTTAPDVPRASYEGVAVAVPVTVPYRRYSTHGAHWFIGQALEALVARSGIAKERIDGLTVSSFSLGSRHRRRRDPAPGREPALARPHSHRRRLGRDGPAPRRARGAGGRRRHRRLHRRRRQPRRVVPADARRLLALRPRRELSLRLGRAELDLRLHHRGLHARARRDPRGLRPHRASRSAPTR